MKHRLLKVLSLIVCMFLFANAKSQFKLTDETVVKDSSGMVYPPVVWKKMMQSGEYILKSNKAVTNSNEMILVKLTQAEIDKRAEQSPKPKESEAFTTGKTIASFKTRDIDGNKVNLKQLNAKIVVLNFWFVACMPCRMEMPELNKLVEEYKKDSVVFIAICLDREDEIKDLLKTNPFNYQIIDNARSIATQYGITSYPTNVILDKEGKVQFHSSGYGRPGAIRFWMKKTIDAIKAQTDTANN